MIIQLLYGVIPIIVVAFGWIWLFNSRIEPHIRKWVSDKYNTKIIRKSLTYGYWWEVISSSATSLQITAWTIIILIGVQFGTLAAIGVVTDKIIQLITN